MPGMATQLAAGVQLRRGQQLRSSQLPGSIRHAVYSPSLQQERKAVTRSPVVTRATAAVAPAVDAPEAVAHLRYFRMQPNKVRVILDQIRGKSYEEALMILEYMPHRACDPILKVLTSAAANAKNNQGLRKSRLFVSECYADEGPILKRFQPRAQGRAYAIHKYLTHITIKVKER